MSNGFKIVRNHCHLIPALEKNANYLDIEFVPYTNNIINTDHYCNEMCNSDEEDDEEIQTEFQTEPESNTPAEQPAQPKLRGSACTNKGVKKHYCTGCCPIKNYQKNQLELKDQKLEEVRRNNFPYSEDVEYSLQYLEFWRD